MYFWRLHFFVLVATSPNTAYLAAKMTGMNNFLLFELSLFHFFCVPHARVVP